MAKKNYIEHEVKVRYVDGLLEKSQQWQWFIDYVEENYDFSDINNWSEFFTLNRDIKDIYSCFIKVLEVKQNDDLVFNNSLVQEVYLIAKFYMGKISKEELVVKSNYSKIFQLVIWITKLENQANNTEYIMDTRLFTQQNLFELIDMSTIIIYESEIKKYLRSITLNGTQKYVQCLVDNIEGIHHPAQSYFLENYKQQILNPNAFDYSRISIPQNITWQEEYILDMLRVKIKDRAILPAMIFNNISSPDISLWTEDVLQKLKRYFQTPLSEFIIETIAYILYGNEPSESTVLTHLELFSEFLQEEEITKYEIQCSSFEIIRYLIEDGILKKYYSKTEYASFMKAIQTILNPEILEILLDSKLKLSIEQKDIIKDYYKLQYKKIDDISFATELLSYFKNEDTVKALTNEYFYKVTKKFKESIEGEYDPIIPSLFYWYMKFLIRLNKNVNIDKQFLNQEIIQLQLLWEEIFYDKCLSQLNCYQKEFTISNEMVEQYNNEVLFNPFLLAQSCIISNEGSMCRLIEDISEHALIYMINNIYIDKLFPEEESSDFNYERHEIDDTLKNIVNDLIDKYGYRFLNILDKDIYVRAIHKRYVENARSYIGIFHKERELYENLLLKELGYNILAYNEELTLGHITQLFPIVENKIRELGTLLNIIPFKLSEKEFMHFKDPSSILREILLEVYRQVGNYENVSDLLFVYNFLYNSNSLNIRNECIHGRKYIEGFEMKFAFKTVLLSLSMITRRIKIIYECMND